MMRAQIQNLSQHVVWTRVVCPNGSLDSIDETLEFNLELGLNQTDWDKSLSYQNVYLCEHLFWISLDYLDCFEAYTVIWFLYSSRMCSAILHDFYQIPKMGVMVQCRTNLIDMIDPMNIENNSNLLNWSLMDKVCS